ncbi:PLD3 [Acrasis kona]|uniref:PLD3 n=1 Tax=Acrasis kona TaxID=1008807 RepID=A0AAW2Z5H2_9EUKA
METSPILSTKDFNTNTSIQDVPQSLFDYIEQEEDKQISEKFNAGFLYDSFHNKQNKDKMISNVICYVLGILAIVVVAIVASFSVVLSTRNARLLAEEGNCESTCRVQIVESIPDGLLELRPGTNYTYNSWMDIINGAKSSLKLAHFYSNLVNDAVPEAAGYQGNDVHNALISAKRDRNIDIEIVMNTPTKQFPDLDTVKLLNDKIAKVYWLDWAKAFKSGIIHTKLMIADDDAFYLGSANMDWTSLSQVKELGIHVTNCKCLTKDVTKVYETYRYVARDLQSDMNGFSGFPQSLFSSFKDTNRLKINDGSAFFSSSPRIMAPGRNDDLEALLHVLSNSTSQINVSVMDYLPLLKYGDKKQILERD